MLNLAKRNLKLYFRQRSAVFFSLLSVLIIIGLYLVFLGDIWKSDLQGLPGVDILMNSWLIAGIVAVTSITTAMGVFGIMVEDRVRKVSKDFYASPLRRVNLLGGYVLSAYLVGLGLSLLAFALGEGYLVCIGGSLLPFPDLLRVLGILLVSGFLCSSFVFFLVSFFSSNSAFTTASTVLGTLIGFVTGIYLPLGSLPEAVQWGIKLFPVSHAAALLRQVLLKAPMAESFSGAPAEVAEQFSQSMGVTFTFGQTELTPALHLLILAGTGVLFFLLALWNVSRKKRAL